MASANSSRHGRHRARPGGNRPRTHPSRRSQASKPAGRASVSSRTSKSKDRSGPKQAPRSKREKSHPTSVRGDSLLRKLRDARERWEDLTGLLDVTHAALISEKDWALVIEDAANVLYRSVLCRPMRDEIRWLGKLIMETPEEAKSSAVFTRTGGTS
jgi:hypothetical protein